MGAENVGKADFLTLKICKKLSLASNIYATWLPL